MYLNKKAHFLSDALFWSAGIHMTSNVVMTLIRRILRARYSSVPDMDNTAIWACQIAVAAIQVVILAYIFIKAWDKLNNTMAVVDESDRIKMAVLQQEIMGNKLPALTGSDIQKLLELWGVILVGIRMVYEICSMVYRRFISDLVDLSEAELTSSEDFIAIYNNTHGFKYIGLLIAISLGIIMTGIFLNDKFLKIVTMIMMTFFLLSFILFGMHTVIVGGYSIGIVWTSVIFHLLETVGICGLGIYLRKSYIGL